MNFILASVRSKYYFAFPINDALPDASRFAYADEKPSTEIAFSDINNIQMWSQIGWFPLDPLQLTLEAHASPQSQHLWKSQPKGLEGSLWCAILAWDSKGRRAFMRMLSTEGRGVGLCWALLKPQGFKGRGNGKWERELIADYLKRKKILPFCLTCAIFRTALKRRKFTRLRDHFDREPQGLELPFDRFFRISNTRFEYISTEVRIPNSFRIVFE